MNNKLIFTVLMLVSGAVFAAAASNKDLTTRTHSLEKQVQSLQSQLDDMQKVDKYLENRHLDSLVEMYAHGPALVTSPALGVRRSLDDASDLMVKWSSINEDLVILKTRKKMDSYAINKGIPIPQRPIIAVSGYAEGQVSYLSDYSRSKDSTINLSGAELDVIAEAGPWATAAMIIAYEDSKPKFGTTVSNSRIKLDRGFVTIGQLDKFPAYFTIGQVFAPFGSYSSHMITDPMVKKLGRVKDRMVILGYNQNGFEAQVYGFSGETHVGPNKNMFDHAGFNAGYDYTKDKFQVKVGASIIGNLAEAEHMQKEIFSYVDKKDSNIKGSEDIASRVCGIDGRIKLGYAPFAILAEYIGAMKSFDRADLSFNNTGAKPQAINVEGSVEFNTIGKPSNFALGYGQTWQALALNLPKNSIFAEYDVAIFKNAILGVEYRHDINYGWNDVAQGNNNMSQVTVAGVGRHQNIATASLAIYF